jgi:hypothetical protein
MPRHHRTNDPLTKAPERPPSVTTALHIVLDGCVIIAAALFLFWAVVMRYQYVPRRHRAALFDGTLTRVISDAEAADSVNDDGTLTLTPHFRLPFRALYFYSPQANHRGAFLNHSPKVAAAAVSSVVSIHGSDLAAAAAAGRVIGRRRWDKAVAIRGRSPVRVAGHVTSGVVINEWKGSYCKIKD